MLTPESRLVLLTAGGASQNPHIARLLEEPLDWQRVVNAATQQRAARPLTDRLRDAAPGRVPAEVLDVLRRRSMVSSFQQLHLEDRLSDAVATLEGAGIDVLLLKGAALAATVYDSFEDRPMSDLDLLVEARDAVRAEELLLGDGWRAVDAEPAAEFYEEHQHRPPLDCASGTGIRLEIHTDLFLRGHPFAALRAAMWAEAEPAELGGRPVRVPSRTHLILHLCVHFAWAHMARSGAWRAFRDLHALEERGGIDWDALVAAARYHGAASSCYWTLRLARDLARLPAPDHALAALAPPYGERTLDRLARHLETGLMPTERGCPSVRLARWMWLAAIRPAASGHGRARPWSRTADANAIFAPGQTDHGITKLRVHLRQLPLWRRYLTSLMRPGGPAPSSRSR